MLISVEGLDCKPYNTSDASVTWETCSLRKWLNNGFINTAFSADGIEKILTVTVPADKNPEYNTNPGNATNDKIFLLSIAEVNQYFKADHSTLCYATEYAVANGARKDHNDLSNWWLRSPGKEQNLAAQAFLIYRENGVDESGRSVDSDSNVVRPALWVDLS